MSHSLPVEPSRRWWRAYSADNYRLLYLHSNFETILKFILFSPNCTVGVVTERPISHSTAGVACILARLCLEFQRGCKIDAVSGNHAGRHCLSHHRGKRADMLDDFRLAIFLDFKRLLLPSDSVGTTSELQNHCCWLHKSRATNNSWRHGLRRRQFTAVRRRRCCSMCSQVCLGDSARRQQLGLSIF